MLVGVHDEVIEGVDDASCWDDALEVTDERLSGLMANCSPTHLPLEPCGGTTRGSCTSVIGWSETTWSGLTTCISVCNRFYWGFNYNSGKINWTPCLHCLILGHASGWSLHTDQRRSTDSYSSFGVNIHIYILLVKERKNWLSYFPLTLTLSTCL